MIISRNSKKRITIELYCNYQKEQKIFLKHKPLFVAKKA
nr:MAG TPA: hypothetical protein [Caudoviricetes sp.]